MTSDAKIAEAKAEAIKAAKKTAAEDAIAAAEAIKGQSASIQAVSMIVAGIAVVLILFTTFSNYYKSAQKESNQKQARIVAEQTHNCTINSVECSATLRSTSDRAEIEFPFGLEVAFERTDKSIPMYLWIEKRKGSGDWGSKIYYPPNDHPDTLPRGYAMRIAAASLKPDQDMIVKIQFRERRK